MKRDLYLKNVSTLEFNKERCVACGMCINVCPHEVFDKVDNKIIIINKDRCMECGACMNNCSVNAIKVKPGVGCAFAIIKGFLTGSSPSCGCDSSCGGGSSGCC
jgi:NAD-dependent dihydropyrimidine dehydrogenase PreA subunit